MIKKALIIANTEYLDPGLARLDAPGKDAEDFARVLRSPDFCAFDEVKTLLNEDENVVSQSIDAFLSSGKPSDLLLIYFSGHGMRDEKGDLYLAVKNTARTHLRSTAIKSDFIREGMDSCRSKKQVLILDCCYSGAYARTKAQAADRVVTSSTFNVTSEGRIVLTASNSTQFAWQGDEIIGDMENSVFTNFLIKGLEGEADDDGDGKITVDELYDYAYEQVTTFTPNQTPVKWTSGQQGEVILRENVPPSFSMDLIEAINSPLVDVRIGTVSRLNSILKGNDVKLARSAKLALERMAIKDDSRRVTQAAAKALGNEIREELSKDTTISQLRRENTELQRLLQETSTTLENIKKEPVIDVSSGKDKTKQIRVYGIAIFLVLTIVYMGVTLFTGTPPFAKPPTASSTLTPGIPTSTATAPVVLPPIKDTPTPTMTAQITSTPTSTATVTPTVTASGTSDVFIDSKGVVMKLVPAGNFIMGNNNADPDEEPSHSVYLSAFYIDRYEVTNNQYEACVNDRVCKPPVKADAPPHRDYYGNPFYNDYPVVYVNWNMAITFCAWRDAALPTEAQWEKAARGTDARLYPWGKDVDCQRVNYHSGNNSCPNGTTRVGNYQIGESPYGIYDLAGNIWEWVFDWYSADYYKGTPWLNPEGPETGQARVLKGGSWSDDEWAIRSSNRLRYSPNYSNFNTGFRCARGLPTP